MTRRAVVSIKNLDQADTVAKYLPSNYSIAEFYDTYVVISGLDHAGRTLDGYVIPRLSSGMFRAKEVRRCSTIGCQRAATHTLDYSFQGSRDEPETDTVCFPCGEGYTRRPALQATLTEGA